MSCEQYMIRQISLFSENKPGRLAAMAKACQEENVNILAFSIAEAEGFGVIRALVDKPDAAFKKLTSMGFNVAFTHVIAVEMKDESGKPVSSVYVGNPGHGQSRTRAIPDTGKDHYITMNAPAGYAIISNQQIVAACRGCSPARQEGSCSGNS